MFKNSTHLFQLNIFLAVVACLSKRCPISVDISSRLKTHSFSSKKVKLSKSRIDKNHQKVSHREHYVKNIVRSLFKL